MQRKPASTSISLSFMTTSLFSFLGLLAGCSQFQSQSTQEPQNIYYTPKADSTLERELGSATLACSSPTTCPRNIGMIYSIVRGGTESQQAPSISACTGFLISDNVVATNQHCIPKSLQNDKASCESDLAIRFIKNDSSGREIYSCKRILSLSSQKGFSPDYAFFEIESTGRQPLVVARNGLRDKQHVLSIKMTPIQSPYTRGGSIEQETCEIVLGSMLNLVASTPWSPTGTAVGCNSVHGNSGSPVLNENGEVLGILQSRAEETYRTILDATFTKFGLAPPAKLPPHFQFTNLTCVSDPVSKTPIDPRCKAVEEYNVLSCIALKDKKTVDSFNARVQSWADKLPVIFGYEFITDESTGAIEAKPACVLPKAGHESAFSTFVAQKGIYGFRTERLEMNYTYRAVFAPRFGIDETMKVLPITYQDGVFSVETVKLTRDGNRWKGTLSSSQVALDLPDCSPIQLEAKAARKSPSFVRTKSGEVLTEERYRQFHKDEGADRTEKKYCQFES